MRQLAAIVSTALVFGLGVAQSAGSVASWTIQPTPNPTGSGNFEAVSCASATSCVAVGYTLSASGGPGSKTGKPGKSRATLAEHWDGSTWTMRPTPTPASGGVLSDVSCTSASACIAVGQVGGLRPSGTLAESWDGTSWTIQQTPRPADGGFLVGVSCTSATYCVAVGLRHLAGGYRPLAERWDGQKWAIQRTPTPRGGSLYGVSCTSATTCIAVGASATATGELSPFAERWNGASWKFQLPPVPKHGGLLDGGVSCTSGHACIASGRAARTNAETTFRPLAERWNGHKWTIQRTPKPGGSSDYVAGRVSCISADICIAVGETLNDFSGARRTVAQFWDGHTWTIQPTANPVGGGGLGGVSCTSAAACMAVGSTGSEGAVRKATLAEQYG